MARVRLQNQEFEIPSELITLDAQIVTEKGEEEAKKQRDSNLKRWLSQVSPAATNATLTWSEDDKPDGSKETIIRVTPQLGTKGGVVFDALVERLCALPQRLPEIIALAWELQMLLLTKQLNQERLVGYQRRIIDTLEHEDKSNYIIGDIARRLREAKAVPSPFAPLGF
ncbi:hypothetical protein KSF_107270 [Reticulibacter mediterranei]|uniref:Uncharacterized protein n=1 Tax=Reticulibacter mediterranei TaxID=2778369 RepID=A0A8J3IRH7_9CHLR|nr:hypothetical protein [Reticulibacter mediterranei]GHP00680.1 hypothetical protein KSF_107270 [Reticulibacter mediterranei]